MKNISFLKLDLLRELGSIGAGHAATSLSELANTQVDMSVPEIRLYPSQRIMDRLKDEEYFVLRSRLEGGISGMGYLVLSLGEARPLAGLLLGADPASVDMDGDMAQSALKEAANILLSSYMSALGDLTGFTVLADVPAMDGPINKNDVEKHISDAPADDIVYVKSNLTIKRLGFDAALLFVPDQKSLRAIFAKLGLPE
ncbi:MAG: chemotaxis protein CheC [Elusimicrobiales bacterium]|nr:chemotaxis protein CheC [Elusimicrobiales bacterium]